MYEDKTSGLIQTEMLANVSDDYDKTVGSFIYDSLKPTAIQMEKMYVDLSDVSGKFNIENISADELDAYIEQRTGVTRRQATYAIGTVTVTGTGTINEGDLFETESGIQFEATETVAITTSGDVSIQAVVSGSSGNVPANQITIIPVTLSGFTTVTNAAATSEGYDAETDESLIQRYYERVRTPATSGNKYHYKNWAKEVSGVGDVRVVPLWDGANTVKVIIIDSDKQPASSTLVADVQSYIDPGVTGSGDGVAPIGAYCTVVSATAKTINVSFTPVIASGYTSEEVIEHVASKVTSYLQEIAFVDDYVSYAMIGSLILACDCVTDYSALTVNDGATNVSVDSSEVAVLGSVTIV